MDDSVVVEVVNALDRLAHEVSRLGLRHGLPALVQLQEGLEVQSEKLSITPRIARFNKTFTEE